MLPPKSSTHVTVKSRLAQSARTNSVDHALNYVLPIYLSILLPTVDEQQELNCDKQVLYGRADLCRTSDIIREGSPLHRHCTRQVRSTTGKTVDRTSVGALQFSERIP